MNESELKREKIVLSLLQKVMTEKSYSSIELDKALTSDALKDSDRAYITKLFYGVLDKSIQFDFIIGKLCVTSPKVVIKLIIKIGLYLLRYMDTPDYAAVSKTVELAKISGKKEVAGFINAVLKKSPSIELPKICDNVTLAINASYPLYIVDELIKDYGFEFCKDFLLYKGDTDTHIRHNGQRINKAEFELKYPDITQKTSQYGYYACHNRLKELEKPDYIIQSLSSMIACNVYYESDAKNILDLCAAPGGKSIYLKELYKIHNIDAVITACDVHPHRVELIKKYAKSAGSNITVMQNDATVLVSEWQEKFDLVVCDVPCSGLGVVSSKPEILFNRTLDDILALSKLQLKIFETAAQYVKSGGTLCYSTCTVLKKENDEVIEKFLKSNSDFNLSEPYTRLFPHIDHSDGFFVCKLKKIK